jgi:hypothetical protein
MYWKASYQKAESERLRLLNELDLVKRERDALRSHEESQRPRGKAATNKRKRDTSPPPTNKKGKIQPAGTTRNTDLELDDDDFDFDLGKFDAPTTGTSCGMPFFSDAESS